jgi:hypothetical protein
MKNKFILSGILLLSVFFSNGCKKEDVKPELTADFNVEYLPEFQNTIYPSLIFGFNEMERQEGEPMNYFNVTVKPNIETDIKIVINESNINYETIITENNVTGEKEIIPQINWKYDELKELSQPGYIDLTFICQGDENKELGRKTVRLSYRSINECVLSAKIDNEQIPLYFMIAGYINEDHPILDQFLQTVLDNSDLTSFVGYQHGADVVDDQVEAIFYTLRAMGVTYSNITTTSNTNTNVVSQNIRFCSEVLNNTQANCADGTAFFCSVLRKIGIHTLMIFVPGHVYLGYYLDEEEQNLRILETTVVGNSSFDFVDALNYQVGSFNSKIPNFNNGDYFDHYFIIDVDEARQIVKPIGLK